MSTATPAQLKTLHACIKKVTEDLDGLRFNTAISALMVFVNEAMTWETKPVSVLRDFLILLHLRAASGGRVVGKAQHVQPSIDFNVGRRLDSGVSPWPKFDPALLVEDRWKFRCR